MKMKKNQDQICFLNMMAYGFNTIVQTRRSKIDWYMNAYETQPDKRFGAGVGKKKLSDNLKLHLAFENSFFDANPNLQNPFDNRWLDFLEDCIIYATLIAHLNKVPVQYVDNETIAEMEMVKKYLGAPNAIHDSGEVINAYEQ